MSAAHHHPALGTARGHGLTLALLAACCAVYRLAEPHVGAGPWMLPAAVTTVLAARWFSVGPAVVGLLAGTLAGALLFARPQADGATMLAREAGSIAVTLLVGALVIWTVTELRTRAARLAHEVAMRRQAELDLDASRRQFEQFLDVAPFCAYLKDADGRFLFTNRHLRAIYPEVVAGRTVHDMFTAEQADDFTRNDDWVRQTGERTQCEEVAVGADGVMRHWSTFTFPVMDDRGRRGVGGVSVEITDRKRADDQVIRSESLLRRLIEVQEPRSRRSVTSSTTVSCSTRSPRA